jgi:hypothetical protein
MVADPPRGVPLTVGSSALLGGRGAQFGWVLIGVGIAAAWIYGASYYVVHVAFFTGGVVQVRGEITDVVKSGHAIGERTVYEHHYEFEAEGETHRGMALGFESFEDGDEITIEYPAGDPARARVQGIEHHSSGIVVALLIAVAGLVIAVRAFVLGIGDVRLVGNGIVASGVLVSRKRTDAPYRNRPFFQLTFRFEDKGGTSHEVLAETYDPRRFAPRDEATAQGGGGTDGDENAEVRTQIAYDPADPSKAQVLDFLPGRPRIEDDGRIALDTPWRWAYFAAIPAATIAGHAWWVLRLLMWP